MSRPGSRALALLFLAAVLIGSLMTTAGSGQAAAQMGQPLDIERPATVFGLSPTAAVIVAAGLLVIVIFAIVAMTRGGDETIATGRGRRPPDSSPRR